VYNLAYLPINASFSISEASSPYEFRQDPCEWTDKEIAAIRAALRRLTAIRIMNNNDAEDLVQETLLTLIAKRPGAKLHKGPLIWSMGILRHKVGNYYRKAQRNASLDQWGESAKQARRQSMLDGSPEAKLLNNELQQTVEEAMAQLPSSQRRPIELLLEGFDVAEIVRLLSPERYQNVINRLYRGRKKLAWELSRHGYGPDAKTSLHKLKRCRIKQQKSEDSPASGDAGLNNL
jgi:RNA polymerase sigma factor (sigma-70 family)